MKPVISIVITILTLLAAAFPTVVKGSGLRESQSSPETTLRTQLAQARTTEDSLQIMFNLYDYLEGKSNLSLTKDLYELALRTGDQKAILEVTRYMANNYMSKDSILTVLQERTRQLPESDDRTATETFIKMMKNINHVRFATDEEAKEKQFHQFLKLVTLHPPTDIYERIVLLHAICVYMGESTDSELLNKYLDQLGALIDSLPEEAAPLKNLYYVQRALIYTEASHPEKAIAADRQLLSLIDSLQTMYTERGRIYRDYNPSKYVIYTRMMYNYPLLTLSEFDKIYGKVQEIIVTTPRAARSAGDSLRPQLYYALAHGNQKEALEILKRCIDLPYNRTKRRQFLKHMIECARATGDKETLLWASSQYNILLENHLRKRLQDRYKELEIVYDLYDMRENYNTLQIEKERAEAEANRFGLTVAIVFVIALAILVFVLLRLVRRQRQMAASLEEKNSELTSQRNTLEDNRRQLIEARDEAEKANAFKATFINNFSREVSVPMQVINEYTRLIVDFVDDEHRKHIDNFAKLVKNNTELLSTMINDMLHLSELQNGTIMVHPEVISTKNICALAVESVKHRLSETQTLLYDKEGSDKCDIYADHDRVLQILISLLLNSIRLVQSRSIILSTKVNPSKESIQFIVTDTGEGITVEKAVDIFNSLAKYDRDNFGVGLGLSISRALAKLLGGSLEVDSSFKEGAKFILTLPLRYSEDTMDTQE